jgi:SAM-dependent methyltransferase
VINIPTIERALSELTRILKPGGRLALYVTNDRAVDYAVLKLLRFLLRRSQPKLETAPLGRGCWFEFEGDRLWVWRINVRALTRHLESLGLRRVLRTAGSLTELHSRVGEPLRSLMLRLNNVWHRLHLPTGPCVTNLLVFEKPVEVIGKEYRTT